ncbi:hypothetical protein DIPPA_30453 [Diplonema papillatum]|nr:hypothetical protein DIPPA_30453 [Diplonema papillatum]
MTAMPANCLYIDPAALEPCLQMLRAGGALAGRRGNVGIRPVIGFVDNERPCGHNQWKKQTKKRGKLVLRCSVCSAVWKTRPEVHEKCADFHSGCCKRGDECPHPHIYARRETPSLARRKARLSNEEADEDSFLRIDDEGAAGYATDTSSNSGAPVLQKPSSCRSSASSSSAAGDNSSASSSDLPTSGASAKHWISRSQWRHDPYCL